MFSAQKNLTGYQLYTTDLKVNYFQLHQYAISMREQGQFLLLLFQNMW